MRFYPITLCEEAKPITIHILSRMGRLDRLALYTSLAAAFATITGLGAAVYTLTSDVIGTPTSFEYLSGLWFLASIPGLSFSIALLVSTGNTKKQRGKQS